MNETNCEIFTFNLARFKKAMLNGYRGFILKHLGLTKSTLLPIGLETRTGKFTGNWILQFLQLPTGIIDVAKYYLKSALPIFKNDAA